MFALAELEHRMIWRFHYLSREGKTDRQYMPTPSLMGEFLLFFFFFF